MAVHNCTMCEAREADLLVSLTSTGDTVFLCLVCTPPWVEALFSAAGLPPIVFEMADQAAGEAEDAAEAPQPLQERPATHQVPDPEWDDVQPPQNGAGGRLDGPGLLEQVERADGALPVKPAGYRRPKSAVGAGVEGEAVEAESSDATVD